MSTACINVESNTVPIADALEVARMQWNKDGDRQALRLSLFRLLLLMEDGWSEDP